MAADMQTKAVVFDMPRGSITGLGDIPKGIIFVGMGGKLRVK